MNTQEAAQFFLIGLETLTKTVEELEEWASEQVGASDEPSFEICELATATSLPHEEIREALTELAGEYPYASTAWNVFCKELHNSLRSSEQSVDHVVKILYKLYKHNKLGNEFGICVSVLEDNYSLYRDQIFGDEEMIRGQALEILEGEFDGNTPEWSNDNNSLDRTS